MKKYTRTQLIIITWLTFGILSAMLFLMVLLTGNLEEIQAAWKNQASLPWACLMLSAFVYFVAYLATSLLVDHD